MADLAHNNGRLAAGLNDSNWYNELIKDSPRWILASKDANLLLYTSTYHSISRYSNLNTHLTIQASFTFRGAYDANKSLFSY